MHAGSTGNTFRLIGGCQLEDVPGMKHNTMSRVFDFVTWWEKVLWQVAFSDNIMNTLLQHRFLFFANRFFECCQNCRYYIGEQSNIGGMANE
ncbi:hypothetical protein ES708_19111 [subsurface metagenome]